MDFASPELRTHKQGACPQSANVPTSPLLAGILMTERGKTTECYNSTHFPPVICLSPSQGCQENLDSSSASDSARPTLRDQNDTERGSPPAHGEWVASVPPPMPQYCEHRLSSLPGPQGPTNLSAGLPLPAAASPELHGSHFL